MDTTLPDRRPMSASEILSAALTLYTENAGLFLGVLAVLLIPQAILDAILPVLSVLSIFTTTGAVGALILAVSVRYLGRSITIGDAYAGLGGGTYWNLLLANIVAGVLVAIGFVLLIIPGVYLAVRFAFVSPAVVLERKSIGEAFTRSGDLVRGSWWRVFGIGILVFVIYAVANGVLARVLGSVLSAGAGNAIGEIVGILVYPFVIGALILLYYDLRIREEGSVAADPGFTTEPY